ncbi:Uncharacterized protein Fot_03095 [Forsythia ovata]|uniref:Uncharacterized protein n=1 Tax=Forsythia ovata TaxID=205694 RepID=A0ABD1X8Q6_9LAMI
MLDSLRIKRNVIWRSGTPVMEVMIPWPKEVYWCHLGYFSVSTIREACLGPWGKLKACFRHLKRGLKYSLEFRNSSGGVGFRGLHWASGRGLRLPLNHCYACGLCYGCGNTSRLKELSRKAL